MRALSHLLSRALIPVVATILVLGSCDSTALENNPGTNDPSDPTDDGSSIPEYATEEPGIIVFSVEMSDRTFHVRSAPFDKPEQSSVISPLNRSFSSPRISGDGKKVIVQTRAGGDQPFEITLRNGEIRALEIVNPVRESPMFPDMNLLVWNATNDGFFYSGGKDPGGQQPLWFYSITDQSRTNLRPVASPFASVGVDTLIAATERSLSADGYYLINYSGSDIGKVPLDAMGEWPDTTGIRNQSVVGIGIPDWNPVRRQLVFEVRRSSENGLDIAMINLDGTGFRYLTRNDGVHYDQRPRWGPNGVVIFERGPNVSGHRGESLLMMYDTDSNELTEFLSLVSIPGAAGISFVDHAATTE